jgi:hypothetical protein
VRTKKSIALVIGFLSFAAQSGAEDKKALIDVRQPTVIAFFGPVTQDDLNKGDTNEALSDFQYYAAKAGPKLKSLGIQFHKLYAHSFRIRVGEKTVTFQSRKVDVGYYFVAPGRQARIEYGVMTDDDLVALCRQYFGLLAKSAKP